MDIFIWWLLLSIVVGVAASSKGRSGFGYFLLAMILSPLIAGLLILLMPSLTTVATAVPPGEEVPTPTTHVRCPDCRELVRADAHKCKHCGSALVPQQLG